MVISAAVAVVRWSFEGRDAMGGAQKMKNLSGGERFFCGRGPDEEKLIEVFG